MLKTTTLFAGALLLSSVAFGQGNSERIVGKAIKNYKSINLPTANSRPSTVSCSDTMNLETIVTQPTYYTTSDTADNYLGYVFGSNDYGDKAKANQFVSTGQKTITSAFYLFAVATEGAPANSMVNFKVWDSSGASGGPGAVLATKSLPLTQIVNEVADGDFTYVTFDNPVTVTGNFYVGFETPVDAAGGDSVALYQTTPTSNVSPNLAWEQWSDNSWHSFTSAWGANFTVSGVIIPVVEFDLTAGFTGPATLDLASGTTATFTNTSTGGSTYNWSFQGGMPATSTSMTPGAITYSSAGTYNVELTVTNGNCTETFTQQIVVSGTVGISEELAKAVKVYPNPATSRINVEMPGLEAKNIVVTNAIGQVVKQQNVTATDVNFVDVANLSAGMYYVQIVTEAGSVTKKVSVQK